MPTLGSILFRHYSLPSTNDLAREMAAAGACEGVAVLALGQTAGRGRQGRSWSSPSYEGLYLSLIIRPQVRATKLSLITLASAVAVAETLTGEFGIQADIKWPNDIMAQSRKICGILVESAIEASSVQYAVLGIGLNVAQRNFSPEINQAATSMFLETGRNVPIDIILKPLLESVNRWYRNAIADPCSVLVRWEQLSSYARGCEVRITSSDGALDGVTRGLTATGALVVELRDGRIREIVSGEVSLRTRVQT